MTSPDVSEIRRVLQVYDQSAMVPPRQAVGMLEGITALIAKSPAAYDLLDDPTAALAWSAAGGESYCEPTEFTNLLAKRWLEVFNRPDFANAGFDKDDLEDLKDDMEGWIKTITATESEDGATLEFGDSEELMTKLDELIEAAPEPDSDEESSD